jgi:hypothetical protein
MFIKLDAKKKKHVSGVKIFGGRNSWDSETLLLDFAINKGIIQDGSFFFSNVTSQQTIIFYVQHE